ncbi:hypothetical protein AKO1_010831 [Acrasis kona]|uniref:Uncharacterized protein n=1 Tax=Acrasis kona TaxID=1008807 RepID=A0AAW2YKJ0_9EUKA
MKPPHHITQVHRAQQNTYQTRSAADIPVANLSKVKFQRLVVPVMDQVLFVNGESCGLDLNRVNKIIDQYYHLSEFIIKWNQKISGQHKYKHILRPFSFIPAIRKYNMKAQAELPSDMMSSGDIGVYINITNKIVVVDSKKLQDKYNDFINLYHKYRKLYNVRKLKTKQNK